VQNDEMAVSDVSASELIVLAAPISGDPYYADMADAIFDFHVQFGETIVANGDRVLILTDKGAYARYAEAMGRDSVALMPMEDIWTRDYGAANPAQPILFRYTAEGQGGQRKGQRDADAVQDAMGHLLEEAGLEIAFSHILNDGGNWVDDYTGNAVLSRKFLRDNDVTEAQARARLFEATGAENIAFIEADEQGGLEHADGVVAFVAPNVLVINSYAEDPEYAADLRADLEAGLLGVKIHEIVTPYNADVIHDERFGSACGLYTNMLVTPEQIYLPQFGIDEDAEALATVRAVTDREVIPVQSAGVCHMGGGVRCMSMQLRGVNAGKLLAYMKQEGGLNRALD
jgi:agmatine/peptidylarginine deiminase